MRIEQLTKKQKHIRPNMDYLINFNGTYQYFSKSAILELQSKLNKLFICDVGCSEKIKAISDKEYIKIFDLYREEFTCVADDEQLKKWGNSDEEIKYIKIRGGRSILLTSNAGIKIAKTLKKMNLL